jgi:UDP-glucose 4-epimerase
MLGDCAEAFPLKWIALRYFNASGSDPDGEIGECHVPETHVIPLVLDAAAGRRDAFTVFGTDYPTPDGTCIRDYIHVSDLADAHVLALRILLQGGDSEAINVGTGRGWSVLELVEVARKITHRDIPILFVRVVPATRRPLLAIRGGHASGSHGRRVTRILPNTFHTPGRGAKAAGRCRSRLELTQINKRR